MQKRLQRVYWLLIGMIGGITISAGWRKLEMLAMLRVLESTDIVLDWLILRMRKSKLCNGKVRIMQRGMKQKPELGCIFLTRNISLVGLDLMRSTLRRDRFSSSQRARPSCIPDSK